MIRAVGYNILLQLKIKKTKNKNQDGKARQMYSNQILINTHKTVHYKILFTQKHNDLHRIWQLPTILGIGSGLSPPSGGFHPRTARGVNSWITRHFFVTCVYRDHPPIIARSDVVRTWVQNEQAVGT